MRTPDAQYRRMAKVVKELVGDEPPINWPPKLFEILEAEIETGDRKVAAAHAINYLVGSGMAQYSAQTKSDNKTVYVATKANLESEPEPSVSTSATIEDIAEYIASVPELDNHDQLRGLLAIAMDESIRDKDRIYAAYACVKATDWFKQCGTVVDLLLLDDDGLTAMVSERIEESRR